MPPKGERPAATSEKISPADRKALRGLVVSMALEKSAQLVLSTALEVYRQYIPLWAMSEAYPNPKITLEQQAQLRKIMVIEASEIDFDAPQPPNYKQIMEDISTYLIDDITEFRTFEGDKRKFTADWKKADTDRNLIHRALPVLEE